MFRKLSRLRAHLTNDFKGFTLDILSSWRGNSYQSRHRRQRGRLLGEENEDYSFFSPFSSLTTAAKVKTVAFVLISLYLISSLPQQTPDDIHLQRQLQRSILENRDDFSASSTTIDLSSIEKNNATVPHFFIIGARRGGTATLSSILSLHPSICMIEEPNFWNNYERWNRGYDWYYDNFYSGPCPSKRRDIGLEGDKPSGGKGMESDVVGSVSRHHDPNLLYGEKGNGYLFRMQTPVRLRRRLPESKFIVLLRNPVDRLYSHWWNDKCLLEQGQEQQKEERNKKEEGMSFEVLVNSNHTSMGYGYYEPQLRTWFKTFDRSRFSILKSEDFFVDPLPMVKELVVDFLGLPSFEFSSPFINSPSQQLETTSTTQVPGRICLDRPPPMSREMRRRLEDIYRPSVRELEKLLGRTFDWF